MRRGPVITLGLAVLLFPGPCVAAGDDPPVAYLGFDQRLNYSDLVCSATIIDTWRTGGTLPLDSSVTAENVARADVESVFKGKLTSATITFRWYSWPAGPGGYVYAGPPLADLRSERRYLLFLRSDGSTGWRVTVPMYQLEVLRGLGELADPSSEGVLVRALDDRAEENRVSAASILEKIIYGKNYAVHIVKAHEDEIIAAWKAWRDGSAGAPDYTSYLPPEVLQLGVERLGL